MKIIANKVPGVFNVIHKGKRFVFIQPNVKAMLGIQPTENEVLEALKANKKEGTNSYFSK